jgi:signal transduction histidine kinase
MFRPSKDPPPRWAEVAAASLLAFITWTDYATGYELELFVFYFLPVAIVAWYAGRRPGLAFAVASAICWYLSDRLSGHPYSKAYLIYWETLMRLVSFATTSLTLSAIRARTRQLEDLLHLVSHDLRLPLGAMVGQAQVLRRHGHDGAFAVLRADAILRSARSMERMIDDLLDGARWEAQTLRLALEPVDLPAWIPSLLERMREAFDVGRIDLRLPDRPVVVRVDPGRLERAVLNLVANALKYSPPEERVSLTVTAPDGGWATLAVSDRGPGISEEDQARLFQRFSRGRGSSDREGVGLGLYSAHLLVLAHGGRIRVESAPGEGAAFFVDLPISGAQRPSGRAPASTEGEVQTGSSPAGTHRPGIQSSLATN